MMLSERCAIRFEIAAEATPDPWESPVRIRKLAARYGRAAEYLRRRVQRYLARHGTPWDQW